MLRAVSLVGFAALAVAGLLLVAAHGGRPGPGWPMAIWGSVATLALWIERWRYRRIERERDGGHWQATGERFEDPETGEVVEVLYDAHSGERRYAPAPTNGGSYPEQAPR